MSSDAANCVAVENQSSPLPDELWWLVLSFLPKRDVANARCVCRFLRDIIDNEDLFTTARLRGHYCLKHSLRLPVHIDAAAAFSPDGRMLVCIMANHRAPVEVRAYDVATGNETFALVPTFVDPTDGAQHLVVASPHDITVSPNGQTFAFATSNPGYVGIIATDTLDTLHMALHDLPWMANLGPRHGSFFARWQPSPLYSDRSVAADSRFSEPRDQQTRQPRQRAPNRSRRIFSQSTFYCNAHSQRRNLDLEF